MEGAGVAGRANGSSWRRKILLNTIYYTERLRSGPQMQWHLRDGARV